MFANTDFQKFVCVVGDFFENSVRRKVLEIFGHVGKCLQIRILVFVIFIFVLAIFPKNMLEQICSPFCLAIFEITDELLILEFVCVVGHVFEIVL